MPRGEGPAGDRTIQQQLEEAWPRDLPARDEQQLTAMAKTLLRADATGVGRARFPDHFPEAGDTVTTAFSRFRIQAVIARQDDSQGRAVVHLVWAGADRGGTHSDGRTTTLHFTRTTRNAAASWTPQPHTRP
ncbi:hypothetical protein [Streptomyces sp. NPDC020681]|uniref:hypothetical protein n=1 Tax=Streptomyces sp. NPDC020681 TaxID=3365083 RepID=UPI0037B1AF4F